MKFLATIEREELAFMEISKGKSLKEAIEKITGKAIIMAMIETDGNKLRAAKVLGINRNTLQIHFKMLSLAEQRKALPYATKN